MAREREYWLPHQEKFDKFYNSLYVQVLVAFLIGANFLANVIEKEIDPDGDKHEDVFKALELVFNILFTIELAINMYGHWFWVFWDSGWNIFDVIVVSIGIINTVKIDLPPALTLLRIMRAFRVFRLFKRVHSLNKIMVAIVHAIPGVANAFLILAIIMSIFAILGVELYHDIGDGCFAANSTDAWMQTSRGGCSGEEYFGNFGKSWYSFFQILTGDSWSEAVARPPMWFFYQQPAHAVGSGVFFILYVLIAAVVLTNVVVAVLLDKMVDPEVADAAMPTKEKSKERVSNEDAVGQKVYTQEDLSEKIASVEQQIGDLLSMSDRVMSKIGACKNEMTTMREQVASVTQRIHGVSHV